MSVQRALDLWPALQSTGLRLGSPAVTDDAAGHAWLDSFMTGIHQRGLHVDFITLHWYGSCTNGTQLTNYLSTMSKYGLPIWLTEFSCYNQTAATNTRFVQQVVAALASIPYLERIAWFTNRPHQSGYEGTALATDSGSLTSVGAAYAALPAARARRPDGNTPAWTHTELRACSSSACSSRVRSTTNASPRETGISVSGVCTSLTFGPMRSATGVSASRSKP